MIEEGEEVKKEEEVSKTATDEPYHVCYSKDELLQVISLLAQITITNSDWKVKEIANEKLAFYLKFI